MVIQSTQQNFLDSVINSYRFDKAAYDATNIAIGSSLRLITTLENELKSIDKKITNFIQGSDQNAYSTLTSILGIGPVLAAESLRDLT